MMERNNKILRPEMGSNEVAGRAGRKKDGGGRLRLPRNREGLRVNKLPNASVDGLKKYADQGEKKRDKGGTRQPNIRVGHNQGHGTI